MEFKFSAIEHSKKEAVAAQLKLSLNVLTQ